MPVNFKHINGNEQIFDGSIGTSLIADGAITSTKLAIGAITSSSFTVNSSINFNEFPVSEFRVENVITNPLPGNAGRLVFNTTANDLFVDLETVLNIISVPSVFFSIISIQDGTHLIVSSTTGITAGDIIVQGASHTTVTTVTDGTHLVVVSSAGFIGAGNASVNFGIVTVNDITHLTVDNTIGMVAGYTITQGLVSTTITSIVDSTHITVTTTAGLTTGLAIVDITFNVLAVPDSTHLTVSNTLGMGPGDTVYQGLNSTTITTVVDGTHLIVGNTGGWALNAASDTTITVSSTVGAAPGMYLTQGATQSAIVIVIDATHLAVASSVGFVVGAAQFGYFISVLEGSAVTSITGTANEVLVNGTSGIPTVGPVILTTPQPIGPTNSPTFVNLTLTGTLNVSGASTLQSTLDVTAATTLHNTLNVTGASTLQSTLDVTAATTLHNTLNVIAATTLQSTLDVTAATTLHNDLHVIGTSQQDGAITAGSTLAVTGLATFSNQVGIDTLTPDASAALDITSTTKGFLVPRMTTVQRNAIVSPATGLEIYNTDSNLFNFYTGTSWLPVGSPVGNVGDVQFNAGGGLFGANPNFYWDITNARLGIGNAAPATTLDVTGTGHFTSDVSLEQDQHLYLDAAHDAYIVNSSSGGFTIAASGMGEVLNINGGFVNIGPNPVNTANSGLSFGTSGTLDVYTANGTDIGMNASSAAITIEAGAGSGSDPSLNFTPENSTALTYIIQGSHITGQLDFISEGLSGQKVLTLTQTGVVQAAGFVTLSNTGIDVWQNIGYSGQDQIHLDIDGSASFLNGNVTITSSNGLSLFKKNYVVFYDTANDNNLSVSYVPTATNTYTMYLPGTTPAAGQLAFISGQDGDGSGSWDLTWSSTLNWSNTTGRLGVGNTTPNAILNVGPIPTPNSGYAVSISTNGGSNTGLELMDDTNGPDIDFNTSAGVTLASIFTLPATHLTIQTRYGLTLNDTGELGTLVTDSAGHQVCDPSAIFEIFNSSQRGFLPPRLNTVNINAISSPATGLLVYNTDTNVLNYYNGTMWVEVTANGIIVTREVPAGAVNGSNATFTLAHTPLTGSESVFLGGLLQNEGATFDYTISGATITFNTAPSSGLALLVSYSY